MDREHERDFFQQEIQKLEQQLKNPQKLQPGSEQRNREVTGESSVLCQRTRHSRRDALPSEHNTVVVVVAKNSELRVTQQHNRAARVTCTASKMTPNSGSVTKE